MRALVVYQSIFGNTRAVAESIAEGLGTGFDVRLADVAGMPKHMGGIDLLVAGGCPDWLCDRTPGVEAVATFEILVRQRGPFPYGASRPAFCRLDGRCLGGVVEPVPFYLVRFGGPLEEGECERAKAWGEGLAAAFIAAADVA